MMGGGAKEKCALQEKPPMTIRHERRDHLFWGDVDRSRFAKVSRRSTNRLRVRIDIEGKDVRECLVGAAKTTGANDWTCPNPSNDYGPRIAEFASTT